MAPQCSFIHQADAVEEPCAQVRDDPLQTKYGLSTVPAQDLKEAIRRIPQEEIDARHQRIKRAMDVSLKKSYLPARVQELQTPYAGYLSVRGC